MALEHVCEKRLQAKTFCSQEFQLTINWDDLSCPICLDFPHNGVLLQCSSYGNGCRAFVCNTDHLHSNCLDRFISACGTDSPPAPVESRSKILEESCKPVCPLCRGEVTGWLVVKKLVSVLTTKNVAVRKKDADLWVHTWSFANMLSQSIQTLVPQKLIQHGSLSGKISSSHLK